MVILHCCNDYLYSDVYKHFHTELLKHIESYFFVPISYSDIVKEKYDKNIILNRCYSKFDKYLFHYKQNKIFNAFKTEVERLHPDILHAHFVFSAGLICLKAKKKYGTNYIVTVRNTDIYTFFKRCFWLRKCGISILKEASRIIFLSEAYKDHVLNKYILRKYKSMIAEKCIVIPNGIDSFWLNNIKKHECKDAGTIRLVYTGSINRNKNCFATIVACRILIKQGYNVEYTIIGDILDYKYFNTFSNEQFIHYIPRKTCDELSQIYHNQDIFIMPSYHETFGLVYAEAMTQGLPIIYTRGQGFDRQFEEGYVGYSVDPNKPQEIAEKIILIQNNYDIISTRCTQLCTKFDWTIICDEYISIYERNKSK